MPRREFIRPALLAAALALGSVPALAVPYNELTDAGDLIGTAADVGPGINQITGSNATSLSIGEIDVFKLTLPGGAFTAKVTAQSGDMTLVLFNSTGIGLLLDDVSGGSFGEPKISTTLAAGVYYLGIFPANDYFSPTSAGGRIWTDGFFAANIAPDGPGQAGAWTGWDARPSISDQGGTYTIDLNQTTVGETVGAAVPEPASLGLLATALLTLSATRRRTRRRP